MNNEEKILSLLEKIVVDQRDLKKDVSGLKEEVSFVRRTLVKIENSHGKIFQALTDGQVTLEDTTQDHGERIENLEDTVEKHSVELVGLRKAK